MTAVLLDLDGVIYNDGQMISGAVDTVNWLRARQIPFLFVTNTTSRPRRQLVEELTRMGIPTRSEEIFTPAIEANRWLTRHKTKQIALFITAGLKEDFPDHRMPDSQGPVEAIVIGNLDHGWDQQALNEAFQLLLHEPPPRLLALGKSRYWLAGNRLQLDSGPFVVALEYATGQRALVLGKPARSFYRAALECLGTRPEETIMIGDDLRGDIEGAQKAGLRGILVRTGKFRPHDLEQEIKPNAVLDSIAQFPSWYEEQIGR
jgi:HAD superfamily hydrolase (TIGR01458 family)